jgi:pyridoxal/pyridoxine/pyridoxamine kinase
MDAVLRQTRAIARRRVTGGLCLVALLLGFVSSATQAQGISDAVRIEQLAAQDLVSRVPELAIVVDPVFAEPGGAPGVPSSVARPPSAPECWSTR